MPKYDRGLNREIVAAVNIGTIGEPFGIAEIKKFAFSKGWIIPDTYINVTLANGANPNHSITYRKYYTSLGNGLYRVKPEFRGTEWE